MYFAPSASRGNMAFSPNSSVADLQVKIGRCAESFSTIILEGRLELRRWTRVNTAKVSRSGSTQNTDLPADCPRSSAGKW